MTISHKDFFVSLCEAIKSPIDSIYDHTVKFLKDSSLLKKHQLSAKAISGDCEHLYSLMNNLLDYSSLESLSLEIEVFNFKDFINYLRDSINAKLKQYAISLEFITTPKLPIYVRGDRKRLQESIRYLIDAVIIELQSGAKIQVYIGYHQDKMTCVIKDNCVTIANLDHMFVPFGAGYKTKQNTGLELVICPKLIKLMSGILNVKQTKGIGRQFWFKIPLPQIKKGILSISEQKIVGFKGERKKILVVDDIDLSRMIFLGTLEPIGFIMEVAENGKQAIEKAKSFQPDLIFMDLMMPEMDGLQASQIIKQLPETKHMKIIVASANVSRSAQKECLKVGCDDYITKPVNMKIVFEKLKQFLNIEWIYK